MSGSLAQTWLCESCYQPRGRIDDEQARCLGGSRKFGIYYPKRLQDGKGSVFC